MSEKPSGAVGLRKDVEDLAKRVAALDGQGPTGVDLTDIETRVTAVEDMVASLRDGYAAHVTRFEALEANLEAAIAMIGTKEPAKATEVIEPHSNS